MHHKQFSIQKFFSNPPIHTHSSIKVVITPNTHSRVLLNHKSSGFTDSAQRRRTCGARPGPSSGSWGAGGTPSGFCVPSCPAHWRSSGDGPPRDPPPRLGPRLWALPVCWTLPPPPALYLTPSPPTLTLTLPLLTLTLTLIKVQTLTLVRIWMLILEVGSWRDWFWKVFFINSQEGQGSKG